MQQLQTFRPPRGSRPRPLTVPLALGGAWVSGAGALGTRALSPAHRPGSPGARAAAGTGSPLLPVPGGPRPQEPGSRSGLPGRNVPSLPRLPHFQPPPTLGCGGDGSRNLRSTKQRGRRELRSIPAVHTETLARVEAVHAPVHPEAPGSPRRQVKASPAPSSPPAHGSPAALPARARLPTPPSPPAGGERAAQEADPDPGGTGGLEALQAAGRTCRRWHRPRVLRTRRTV